VESLSGAAPAGSLQNIDATADTVARQKISVVIHRGVRGMEIALASPHGTTAVVSLPPRNVPPNAVEVNGVVVWNKTGLTRALHGVTSAGMVDGSPRFAFSPGTWRISWDFLNDPTTIPQHFGRPILLSSANLWECETGTPVSFRSSNDQPVTTTLSAVHAASVTESPRQPCRRKQAKTITLDSQLKPISFQ